MSPWLATLLVGVATVFANWMLGAFYYGRLSERVDGHTKDIQDREDSDRQQWDHINKLRYDMGRVKLKVGINGERHS